MKLCRCDRCYLLIVACLLILTGPVEIYGKKIRVQSKTKIIFEKYDTEYFRLNKYLKTVDNLTSLLLGSEHNVKLLPRIIVVDKKKMQQDINIVNAGQSVNIYVNGDLERWRNKTTVNKQIISALLFSKCDITQNKKSLPDWLLTGLNAELQYKTSERIFSPASYMPGIMALVRAGNVPEISTIISHPVKESDGTAYQLYEELCRFLLTASEKLCRNDDEVFAEIVVLAASGKYSEKEIFSSTIGRVAAKRYGNSQSQQNDDDIVQQWFQRALTNKAVNYFFPLSAISADHKFKKLFPVSCEIKLSDKKYKKASLRLLQLPRYWSRLKKPNELKLSLSDQLGIISQQAPIALSRPLHNIRQQINAFGSNTVAETEVTLKTAVKDYYKALQLQISIEDHLADIEQRENYMKKYYRRQFKVLDHQKNSPWDAMEKYLDKAEAKYLK